MTDTTEAAVMEETEAEAPASVDRYEEFARLRRSGMSYREIGLKYDLSHERVRQVLTSDGEGPGKWKRPSAQEVRAVRIAEIAAWLEANGPIPRDVLMAKYGLTNSQLTVMVSEGLPSHLILLPERATDTYYADEDVYAAVRAAWERLRESNPDAEGLSHMMYERLRKMSDPSAPALEARYGWEAVCGAAGVPSGASWRSKESYRSQWSDDDILRAVARYVVQCRAELQRPTYLGFDRWQQEHPDVPSGTLVRIRMRALGHATWPGIIAAAMAHEGATS